MRLERGAQPDDLAKQSADIAAPGIDLIGEVLALVHRGPQHAVLTNQLR